MIVRWRVSMFQKPDRSRNTEQDGNIPKGLAHIRMKGCLPPANECVVLTGPLPAESYIQDPQAFCIISSQLERSVHAAAIIIFSSCMHEAARLAQPRWISSQDSAVLSRTHIPEETVTLPVCTSRLWMLNLPSTSAALDSTRDGVGRLSTRIVQFSFVVLHPYMSA